jgi:hypothetical protein
MMITLSERLRDAIAKARNNAARSGNILDVYKVANEVRREVPQENVALEDIIAALVMTHSSRFGAVEFDPGRMRLELVISVPEGDGESNRDGNFLVAA